MKRTEAVLLAVGATFVAVTAFDVTVNGFFEPASVRVTHFDAGAGSILLLARASLAVVAVLGLIISSFFTQPKIHRTLRLAAGACIFALFWYSAIGVQRYSEQYDDGTFMDIVHRHYQGQSFTSENIRNALGGPISNESFRSGANTQRVWMYTYMPSCGFGWNKRVVYFDDRGRVTGFNIMDEP